MLADLANYLFGLNEYSDEALENLFKETQIEGTDGDDWILVELRQHKLDINADGQPIEPECESLTSSQLPAQEDKENVSSIEERSSYADGESTNQENDSDEHNKSLTANKCSTTSATYEDSEDEEGEEDDDESEGVFDTKMDAKNQETANKRVKRKSRDNYHIGTMEGSWFVTPPPCFDSHKKSTNKVSANPFEDILIEHPSISVFHSHTSSTLDSFYPIPSSSLLPTTNIVPGSPSTSPVSLLSSSSANRSPSSYKSNESDHSADPVQSLPRPKIEQIYLIVSAIEHLTPRLSGQANRSNRSNRGHRSGSSSNNNNNNDEANQIQTPSEARGAPNENHERSGFLSEISNHHLAPMQKAINQGSQKYLKKSFLNRQNLVKFQSNRRPTRRQRCTQRPSGYSNNRKMC